MAKSNDITRSRETSRQSLVTRLTAVRSHLAARPGFDPDDEDDLYGMIDRLLIQIDRTPVQAAEGHRQSDQKDLINGRDLALSNAYNTVEVLLSSFDDVTPRISNSLAVGAAGAAIGHLDQVHRLDVELETIRSRQEQPPVTAKMEYLSKLDACELADEKDRMHAQVHSITHLLHCHFGSQGDTINDELMSNVTWTIRSMLEEIKDLDREERRRHEIAHLIGNRSQQTKASSHRRPH